MRERLLLTSLSAVLGTALLTVCNALSVKRTANDVVTYTREVTYSSSADKDNRVFLKVMSDTGNVSRCLEAVSKTNSRYLTKSRVRLLRARGGYLCANASLLRGAKIGLLTGKSVESVLKNRGLRLVVLFRAAVLN
jgi:hypothetical protein